MIRGAPDPAQAWDESTELDPRRAAIGVSGVIDGDVAALFCETLAGLPAGDAPVALDLSRARVTDPVIARAMADAIRQTTLRLGQVRVLGAPTALRRALAESQGDPAITLE